MQSCCWLNEYAATTVVGTGPRNSSIIIVTLLFLARESNVAGIQPKRERAESASKTSLTRTKWLSNVHSKDDAETYRHTDIQTYSSVHRYTYTHTHRHIDTRTQTQ